MVAAVMVAEAEAVVVTKWITAEPERRDYDLIRSYHEEKFGQGAGESGAVYAKAEDDKKLKYWHREVMQSHLFHCFRLDLLHPDYISRLALTGIYNQHYIPAS